ncbi:MAG: PAS domain-containing protein [Janthinobacterium lividum]
MIPRKVAEEALAASEAHWRGLFQRLREGLILAELVRDGTGRAVDWRYLDVNPAWSELVGISTADTVGRTVRELFPGIEDEWVAEMAGVVETGVAVTFTRMVGVLDRWYEGHAFALDGERFAVLFLEVTQRKRAELRQSALLALSDRLRDLSQPDEIAFASCEVLATALEASVAGYGVVDPVAETIMIERDWTAPGTVPSFAGTLQFRDFGSYIEDLARGDTVMVDDVRLDPRTQASLAAFEAKDTRAFVNLPLFERGRFVALLYVTSARPRAWSAAEIELMREVAERTRAASERAYAELAQRASEAELRLVADNLPVLVAFIDRGLRYRFANGAVRDWYGCTPEALLGRTMQEVLGDGFESRRLHLDRVLEGRPAVFELAWPHADGRARWAELRFTPRPDAHGAIDGFYLFVQDITPRRRVAELLAVRAEALEREVVARTAERNRLWETTNDLMGVAGLDGFLKSVNPAWTRLLGWSEAEMLARPLVALVDPADRGETNDVLRRLGAGETISGFTDRLLTQAGSRRVIMWTAVPDPGTAVFHIIGRDITEQTHAEEQLRQSQKMEAVGQLTGGLAHDFNNLLAGVTGSLELLQTRIGQGRVAEAGRYIQAAQGAAQRAAALTHRLLAFSRRQSLDPKPTDVNRLVAGMAELIQRTAGPAISLESLPAESLWATLVDPGQLENALLNLCINARDAMPDGGSITVETANLWLDERMARECDLSPGPYVSLCVSDTGTGMTHDVVAKAFDPFFTTKPIGQGTGLGLSMIYGFARQSGGQVRIHSQPGQGSAVRIYLPRHFGAGEHAEAPPDLADLPRAQQGETVLVVDDEPTVRMLVAEVLEDLGYTAIEAEDGPSGLRVLQSEARIDLLITDVGLPGGMNGRQLADAARVGRPGLRVLFITGYAENAVLGQGDLAPGMHVMTKPFAIEALAVRIKALIAG